MRCDVCNGSGVIIASKWEEPIPCIECAGIGQKPHELWEVDRITDRIQVGYTGWDIQTK